MGNFQLSRETTIHASAQQVHALIDDLHAWVHWSPWEGLDPDLQRTYTGPQTGVGSRYHWKGNSKAGEGTMEITGSRPDQVVVALEFIKPFKATNVVTFTLAGAGDSTRVTWAMEGQRNVVMGLLGRLFFDRSIGKDFEQGLAQLKARAEQAA